MLEVVTELTAIQAILAIGLTASTFCYLLGIYSAEEFFSRRRPPDEDVPRAGITILKPLKGLDIGLYENLASLCRQDYQPLQIICGVADESDPAATVVRRLQRDFPQVDLELVADDRLYGANYKVSNLINMYRDAKHDLIVVADSDIRVRPTYLASLNRAVREPGAGLATCLYRAVNRGPMPSLVESLFINTDFTPLVMVARKVEKSTYAFGATIAIRREILEEIGGFAPLVNTLADDYQLGYRVAACGYRLVLVDEVVDTVLAIRSWERLFDHQLRWARTYRICRPGGYFASVVTHGTLWALLNAVYHSFSVQACLISAGVIGVRYASAMTIGWRHLKTDTSWAAMLAVPVKDLMFDVIWLLAFIGDTVVWGGNRFRVSRDGEMTVLDGLTDFAEAVAENESRSHAAETELSRTAESN
jgi:ceramide glucosyltransferase